jgi:hypothetical protein
MAIMYLSIDVCDEDFSQEEEVLERRLEIEGDDDALIDAARSVAHDIDVGKLPSQMDAALITLGNGIAAWVTRVAKEQASDG